MWWILIAGGIVLAALGGLVVASWRRPELGVTGGRLRPCPDRPNCVCSQDSDPRHAIDPLPLGDDTQADLARLERVLHAMPGASRIDSSDGYLRYEFTSRLMRYVDDVEFQVDEHGRAIHVRSASRVGRSDLGANRKRVAEIRRRFTEPGVNR